MSTIYTANHHAARMNEAHIKRMKALDMFHALTKEITIDGAIYPSSWNYEEIKLARDLVIEAFGVDPTR